MRKMLPPRVKAAGRRGLTAISKGIDRLLAEGGNAQAAPSAIVEDGAVDDTSQAGEISAIRALIKDGFPEYLVDVGAHDGITISNSRPLTLSGWEAILVEANPRVYPLLERATAGMRNVRCANVACSDRPGVSPLYFGSDSPGGAMATLCTDENPWFDAARSDASTDVEVRTLTQLLDESRWPKDFSLLLVDTEGMDYEVLVGLDPDRYRPRIVVTEEYPWNPEKSRDKFRLLLDRGYSFHAQVGCNTMWIANEHVDVCLGIVSSTRELSP